MLYLLYGYVYFANSRGNAASTHTLSQVALPDGLCCVAVAVVVALAVADVFHFFCTIDFLGAHRVLCA